MGNGRAARLRPSLPRAACGSRSQPTATGDEPGALDLLPGVRAYARHQRGLLRDEDVRGAGAQLQRRPQRGQLSPLRRVHDLVPARSRGRLRARQTPGRGRDRRGGTHSPGNPRSPAAPTSPPAAAPPGVTITAKAVRPRTPAATATTPGRSPLIRPTPTAGSSPPRPALSRRPGAGPPELRSTAGALTAPGRGSTSAFPAARDDALCARCDGRWPCRSAPRRTPIPKHRSGRQPVPARKPRVLRKSSRWRP
jgi:hypothetical protein